MYDELFVSRPWTPAHGFTAGIEGPACDADGNLYVVNYEREGTIGKVTPEGECGVFVELPDGSIGNGIRFGRDGAMFIADYTNHNVLAVDMLTRVIRVHTHEGRMNQPNDLAITATDVLFASDPDWKTSTGNLWRIDRDGQVSLLEADTGTTNGIEVSPDEQRLYVNHTAQRNIWVYDLSPRGEIGNRRLLIQFDDEGLDGMRCDVAGNLYVTRWGMGLVLKLSPDGDVLQEITLSGKHCTNLTFGGPDGRTCFVTVADNGNIETFRVDLPGRCWQLWQRAR